MDLEVRIGGLQVNRCSQSATVAMGINTVTNRSNRKNNDGPSATSGNLVITPYSLIAEADWDEVDHPTIQLDNLALGPF